MNTSLPVIALTTILTTTAATAAEPELTRFAAGTPARASEVNGNFSIVFNGVSNNQAQIAALKAEVAALKTQLNNVLAINNFLSLETVNGQPAIRVTGANLQVVNGTGQTATSNGTGNVIVGYDEAREAAVGSQCSLGTNSSAVRVTTEAECTAAGGTWAPNHKSGSHYVIVGAEHNYSRWGGIVVGFRNTSNGNYASVSGGQVNAASFFAASVSGGAANTASSNAASVSGGIANIATAAFASVSGGRSNSATGADASVSGGRSNIASGNAAHVSGGGGDSAGAGNVADTNFSSILGGTGQNTNAVSQTIPALP